MRRSEVGAKGGSWWVGVLAACCAIVGTSGAVLTGPVVNPANGHRYYLLSAQNWNSAAAEARALGGHLATVNDAAENAWIFSTFSTFGGVNRTLMIGLNDAAVEGTFEWADGDTSTYRNWTAGEPNNYAPTLNQDYTAIWPPGGANAGRWNDVALSESATFHGVVEVIPAAELAEVSIQHAVELSWPTIAGKHYQLQWAESLSPEAEWKNIGSQTAGDGSALRLFDPTAGKDRRYYRVVVVTP